MSTRANWFLEKLEVPTDPIVPTDVTVQGSLIDLHNTEPKLREDLHDLVQREMRLDSAGVTCAIRAEPGSSCMACPMFTADDMDPISVLCRVGREQERVVTLLAVALHGDRRDRA